MFCSSYGWKNDERARFCQSCGASLGWMTDEGASSPANWFRRHLNWTLVIAFVLINLINFVVGFLAGWYDVSEESWNGILFTLFIGNVIVTAVIAGWVLNQKGRSLWWLLLTPFWFGWIVWLALGNKRTPLDLPS